MELNYPMAEGLNAYLLKFLHNYKKKLVATCSGTSLGQLQLNLSGNCELLQEGTVGHSSVGGRCVLKKKWRLARTQ